MGRVFLVFIASAGLTHIIKYSILLKCIREKLSAASFLLKDFFSCAMCIGFWSGSALAIISNQPPIEWLLYGFGGSASSLAFDYIIDYFDSKYLKKD